MIDLDKQFKELKEKETEFSQLLFHQITNMLKAVYQLQQTDKILQIKDLDDQIEAIAEMAVDKIINLYLVKQDARIRKIEKNVELILDKIEKLSILFSKE